MSQVTEYSSKVMDHFSNPRNVGEIVDPSGVGTVGNAKCGDIMRMYLDIDDINKLFDVYGYKKVKRVWLDRVAHQGEMFRQFNILYAWYSFGAKRPQAYVKSLETRYLNRLMSA